MEESPTARKDNPLGTERVSALLRKFAVPSVIAMLVSSLYNVVDQIFIGWGVGPLGNAATNVAFPVTTICMAIALTLGIGSAARFSLHLGRKEEDEAAKVVGAGFCMMLFFGTIYAVIVEIFLKQMLTAFGATEAIFDYAVEYTGITAIGIPLLITMNGLSNLARADGSPLYSMMSMVVGAVINTILDPIFIFAFHWGVAGAAWATVIGQAASFIVSLLYLKKFKRVTLKKEYFKLNLKQIGTTATMGMSQGLNQIAITVVQVVMNRSLVYYGALSQYGADIPLAGSGIVMKVNGIIFSIIIGINQGMQPIIGFNYGAKKYSRVKKTYFAAMASVLVITILGLLVFEFFPQVVLHAFGNGDPLYFEFSIKFMRTFLCTLPLVAVNILSANLFAAIGKPVKGALLSLTRSVFFFIPAILILPLFFGLDGILYSGPAADIISVILVLIFVIIELKNMGKENK